MFRTPCTRSLAIAFLVFSSSLGCSAPAGSDASTTDTANDVIATESGRDVVDDIASGLCTSDVSCTDGVFCNGVERCMPGAVGADGRGCVAAMSQSACLAGQTCDETMQRCITQCMHALDADGDGHRAADCGGDDCADDDPNRFPGNPEVCDAMNHDEDCDANSFGLRDTDNDMFVDAQCCNVDSAGTRHCGDDCNDSRPNVHPSLAEACDGLDNNCDMQIDEGVQRTFYPDTDDDGYGSMSGASMMGCNPPTHFAEATGDCDDTNASVHPGAVEQCDGAMLDENCDGTANPAALCTCSGDISRMCAAAPGACAAGSQRCVDGSWGACSITPVPETCNGIDDDCDGMTDEALFVTCYADGDNDGYAAMGTTSVRSCPVPGRDAFAGCPPNQTNRAPNGIDIDCNDTDSTISPGQPELCDSTMRDENCDGAINPASLCMCTDGQTRPCTAPGTCGAGNQTCSAGRFSACSVNPVSESCNGIDDDCDGSADEGLTVTCYVDRDNDGFAATGTPAVQSCPVMGRDFVGGCPTNQTNRAPASSSIDCNDMNAAVSPAAVEQCDSATVDEDCDGTANPAALCSCSGSMSRMCTLPGACAAGSQNCSGGSWGNCSISPVAESCNAIDDDCDGMVDESVTVGCYRDADNDGFAATGTMLVQSCPVTGREAVGGCPAGQTNRAPSGANIDCNDSASNTNPGAPEQCDAAMADENCDGTANPASLCACSGTATRPCMLPGACAAGMQTCSSGTWGACSIGPLPETCNGADDDCDGMTDEGVQITCYADADNDGYAAMGATPQSSCAVGGRAAVGGCATNLTNRAPTSAANADCNDTSASVNPAAAEQCDAAMVDENCDGSANPASLCACSGSATRSCSMAGLSGPCAAGTQTCAGGSWQSCSVQPVTETCNAVDDDCDGMTDEALTVTCYVDPDNDGYAATGAATSPQCPAAGRESVGGCPTGYTSRAPMGTAIDCAEMNATRNPAASEACNGVDDNCNGTTDEGVTTLYRRDADGDGFGSTTGPTMSACTAPSGYVLSNSDCNDASASVHPGSSELCNAVDDDCNGMVDEGLSRTYYADVDRDGFGSATASMTACAQPANYVTNNSDCDDTNGSRNPSAPEVCDGVDNDCDGTVDEGVTRAFYPDVDRDGYGQTGGAAMNACSAPSGYVENNLDCNDAQPLVRPGGVEFCNGADDDCDGAVDEGAAAQCYPGVPNTVFACTAGACTVTSCTAGYSNCDMVPSNGCETALRVFYQDADGDSWGSSTASAPSCSAPAGYVDRTGDCNDANTSVGRSVYPFAPEVCDGIDNDCDGMTDEGVLRTFYRDADLDGYGNPAMPTQACSPPAGYVENQGDCNDANATVRIGATEVCDGVDNDCDMAVDEAGAAASCFPGVPNTTYTCTAGACTVSTCAGGYGNCDGNVANGCETSTTANATNCGMCGRSCGLGGVCTAGTCDAVLGVAAGSLFTCAYRASGRAACWGDNSDGQLGNGTLTQSTTPVLVQGLSAVNAITTGGRFRAGFPNNAHTCANNGGVMFCWGNNASGQLGLGDTISPRPVPEQVGGLPSPDGLMVSYTLRNLPSAGGFISCGIEFRNFSSLGTDRQDLHCWGSNGDGQLGDGTTTAHSTPGPVVAFTAGVDDISMVEGGSFHTCAIRAGTEAWCWGNNSNGELGDGTNVDKLVPTRVGALTGWTRISAGENSTCGIRSGGVYCWGANGAGQLGDGTATASSVPVAVSGLASGVADVAVGNSFACARLSTGVVRCWGGGGSGQLGNGGTTNSSLPVNVSGLTDAVQITAGHTHACARRAAGPVVCWGANGTGALGDGTTTTSSTPVQVTTLTP